MAYQGRILTRSPYYIKASGTVIETAKLDIYIWAGDLTSDKPTSPQFVIEKTPLQSGDDDIYFEISELIRDSYTYTYDPYAVAPDSWDDALWVATDLTITDSTGLLPLVSDTYIAQDGYGYFSEGANPDLDYTEITIVTDRVNPFNTARLGVPVGEGIDSIDWTKDGVLYQNQVITDSDSSYDKIQYVSKDLNFVDKAELKEGSTVIQTVNFLEAQDCENDVVKIRFYNKNGMWQTISLNGRSKKSLTTSKENYTKDLFGTSLDFSYDTKLHQKQTYNISAKETVTLNSGWVPESQNEIYKQILLSEYIWIDENALQGGVGDSPVYLTSNSLEYKTQKYDKLINYTLEFEYSNNEINNI